MRFSAPRSISPSPSRVSKRSQKRRRASTYGLQSDSESNDYSYDSDQSYGSDASDASSVTSSSSSGSFMRNSELGDREQSPKRTPGRNSLSPAQRRYIEETISAIRLRTRHHDPYEEWEKETRRDAFLTARKEQTQFHRKLLAEQESLRQREARRLADVHARQAEEVEKKLQALKIHQSNEEKRLKDIWDAKAKQRSQRIESVIKYEEDKVKAKLEAERKVREEEERRRLLLEAKRRQEEEQRKREEEEKRRKEEEERRKEEEERRKEEEERQRLLKEQQEKAERLNAEREQRQALGMSTAEDDWRQARRTLHQLKSTAMHTVKSDKPLKSAWSALRRQITPKIGQITNDDESINRITNQIFSLLTPNPPLQQPVYFAALSSLSKAILLQAETEVTAEKRAAIPLARVTRHLLGALPHFHYIFFAKLVQRVGGWAIPILLPPVDYDDKPWNDNTARIKAMGYRKSGDGDSLESSSNYGTRVAGIMRVYFRVLTITVSPGDKPVPPLFQLPRLWTWFARIIGEPALLVNPVAPQVIYVALDVWGAEAKEMWGLQWVKMLGLLYEGVTVGMGNGKLIGGDTPEGKAARVRLQLEVERIMNGTR